MVEAVEVVDDGSTLEAVPLGEAAVVVGVVVAPVLAAVVLVAVAPAGAGRKLANLLID